MPAQVKNEYSVYMNDVETAAFVRGIEKGIEKGVAQGVHSGAVRLTLRLAESRFGTLEESLRQRITALPTAKVEDTGIALSSMQTADELQNWLDAKTDGA